MGFRDRAKAFADEHKRDCSLGDYMLSGDKVKKGLKAWPVAGAVAEFEHGASVGARVTATRVVLTGVFALALKKDRNKVYAVVQLADGEQLLIEAKAKDEAKARTFVSNLNQASQHFS